jgi:hypothetical protein
LKASRPCPLALLVEVSLREGKALGSEEGSRLCYEQRKEIERWALLLLVRILISTLEGQRQSEILI